MSDATPPADAIADTPVATIRDTNDPTTLIDHDDISTEVVDIEADAEHFERYQEWHGMAITGVTNDDGQVLLVKNTDPDVCHDWVLPHGPVEGDADWIDTATDWVDGLTGIDATIEDSVHVRRNDITYEPDEGPTQETTTYHVIFSGHPQGGDGIEEDVRYDCDDEWTAHWHDSIPESARETESSDIALFVD